MQWHIESIPEDIIDNFYLHSIDEQFIAEAQLGDTIVPFTEKDASLNSFVHHIKTRGNNTVCATVRTVWKPK